MTVETGVQKPGVSGFKSVTSVLVIVVGVLTALMLLQPRTAQDWWGVSYTIEANVPFALAIVGIISIVAVQYWLHRRYTFKNARAMNVCFYGWLGIAYAVVAPVFLNMLIFEQSIG